MVRAGRVTSSPKASPGCRACGASRSGSPGGCACVGGAACSGALEAGAGPAASPSSNGQHDRRRQAEARHHAVSALIGAAPSVAICPHSSTAPGQSAPIRHINRAKPGQDLTAAMTMGALANHSFVKMNGVGNEIVVVDLRDRRGQDHARGGARGGRARRRALRPAHGDLSAAHPRHRRLHPHLQQRRLGSRRLRQRHALRRRPGRQAKRQGRAHFRDHRRHHQLLEERRRPVHRRHGRAALSSGTRFRWRKKSATPAASNCRSGRSTSRCCTRPRR